MKQRPTLKDIAKALNVSITTVSRALNDKDDIGQETKNKILEVARMMNYKPNAIAISLRKNTTRKLIGVILPSVEHHFFSTILQGITSSSHQSGYLVMIAESGHDPKKEIEIMDQLAEHYVAGIIYAPSKDASREKNLRHLNGLSIPYVLIDRTFPNFSGSFVQHDDFRGSYDATSHMIQQGFRKIAYISGAKNCTVSTERLMGFQHAITKQGLKKSDCPVYHTTGATKEDGFQFGNEFFNSKEDLPQAIITVTDDVAVGLYTSLKKAGITIPDDVAIMGYSNAEISSHLSPSLSTVEQNGQEMGQTAFQFVMNTIEDPNKTFQKTFSSRLLIRESSIK